MAYVKKNEWLMLWKIEYQIVIRAALTPILQRHTSSIVAGELKSIARATNFISIVKTITNFVTSSLSLDALKIATIKLILKFRQM